MKRNFVAKHAWRFNKASVIPSKKQKLARIKLTKASIKRLAEA